MGFAKVPVTLRASNGKNGNYQADFLADSGAWDSMVSGSVLKKLGVEPKGTRLFELADGTKREFQIGGAEFEILGEFAFSGVIFGPDDVKPILGVTALESAGFELDPRNQQLKKLPAIPLKQLCSAVLRW